MNATHLVLLKLFNSQLILLNSKYLASILFYLKTYQN